MITYQEVKKGNLVYKVKLDNKIVGAIYNSPDGFYYRPTARSGGELFGTVEEVKDSLEEE